jgi:hypothetical protein
MFTAFLLMPMTMKKSSVELVFSRILPYNSTGFKVAQANAYVLSEVGFFGDFCSADDNGVIDIRHDVSSSESIRICTAS